jgi:vacuolar-type H+-ATPase subunit E/Vma4
VQLEILKRKQNLESFWKNLEKELSKVGKSPNFSAYSPILEKIEDELYKSLDSAFGIASRAMANRDLANTLTESHGVSREDAKEVTRIREYTEMVRFSSSGGTIAGEDAEREVQNLIQNAKRLCLDFSGRKAG